MVELFIGLSLGLLVGYVFGYRKSTKCNVRIVKKDSSLTIVQKTHLISAFTGHPAEEVYVGLYKEIDDVKFGFAQAAKKKELS